MIQLRKDYVLDRWVIISEKRGKRPHEFKSDSKLTPGKVDFFAPGNEHLTPPEIGRYPKKGKWKMRWFPNKFAAVESEQFSKTEGCDMHCHLPAFGYHEVIVETPSSTRQLWDLPKQDIALLLTIYQERIRELSRKKHIKYVQIFKNHGKEGGTSLIHSHTQIVALPQIPSSILEKRKAIRKNNYYNIINKELKSKRKAFENKHFGAICPYASRFNFEVLIAPKKKRAQLTKLSKEEVKALADILEKTLKKLRKNQWSYNFHLHYDPLNKMDFHIEVTPRLATWAGFEFSTGITINSVSPEQAAVFYRK